MAQALEFNWTNPQTVVPVTLAVGFAICRVTVYDVTVGKVYTWVSQMPSGSYLQLGTAGVQSSTGFTPSESQALFGAPIVGFNQITAPLYFQCNFVDLFGFEPGDTVLATDMAETGAGKTNNGHYIVSKVSGQKVEIEGTQKTGYKEYASGGTLVRIKDSKGRPVARKNHAIFGGTVGTGMAGAAGSVITCLIEGSMNVD